MHCASLFLISSLKNLAAVSLRGKPSSVRRDLVEPFEDAKLSASPLSFHPGPCIQSILLLSSFWVVEDRLFHPSHSSSYWSPLWHGQRWLPMWGHEQRQKSIMREKNNGKVWQVGTWWQNRPSAYQIALLGILSNNHPRIDDITRPHKQYSTSCQGSLSVLGSFSRFTADQFSFFKAIS